MRHANTKSYKLFLMILAMAMVFQQDVWAQDKSSKGPSKALVEANKVSPQEAKASQVLTKEAISRKETVEQGRVKNPTYNPENASAESNVTNVQKQDLETPDREIKPLETKNPDQLKGISPESKESIDEQDIEEAKKQLEQDRGIKNVDQEPQTRYITDPAEVPSKVEYKPLEEPENLNQIESNKTDNESGAVVYYIKSEEANNRSVTSKEDSNLKDKIEMEKLESNRPGEITISDDTRNGKIANQLPDGSLPNLPEPINNPEPVLRDRPKGLDIITEPRFSKPGDLKQPDTGNDNAYNAEGATMQVELKVEPADENSKASDAGYAHSRESINYDLIAYKSLVSSEDEDRIIE